MLDKRAERDAVRYGILNRMESLESDLLSIPGIVNVEFDIRDHSDGIRQVILIPKYSIDPSLGIFEWFDARREQLDAIIAVCKEHGLRSSGDRIEDMGSHWYIVRSCDSSWPAFERGIT